MPETEVNQNVEIDRIRTQILKLIPMANSVYSLPKVDYPQRLADVVDNQAITCKTKKRCE